MAQMKNSRPSEYMGEIKVWDCIEKNLPKEVICYYNREINGQEFDFCLLIEDLGLVIIEVKGWNRSHIVSVKNSDEIILADGRKSTSPKKQANRYRFNLVNKIEKSLHINPTVASMVCYPFLSEEEFDEAELSVVSEKEYTLFREDIESNVNFASKLCYAISETNNTGKRDPLTGEVYHKCRLFFEPDYSIEPPVEPFSPYSKLYYFPDHITMSEYADIFRDYENGIKQTIFFSCYQDVDLIAGFLSDTFKNRSIVPEGTNLGYGELDNISDIVRKGDRVAAFGFEAYYVPQKLAENSFIVTDGKCDELQRAILCRLAETTDFNFDQYEVEHADPAHDIQVRAGAGTGKTYSMVSRVAFLCSLASSSGVLEPCEEIAMLTFTQDAAANMKSRLKQHYLNYFVLTRNTKYLEMVSNIEKIRISTIHSFAKDVIKKTSVVLGVGTNFSTVSGGYEKQKIFDRLFAEFLGKYNRENKPLFFDNLPLKIDDLRRCLLEFSNKLYSKGCDIKSASMEAFGRPIDAMPYINDIISQVIIETEKEYTRKLMEDNSLTLSEYMIYLDKAVSASAFNANLFHYKYLFIDEFQDTDDAQIAAFLKMQSKVPFRFFVVGDLKQSIYRFRGATMDAFRKMGCEDHEWLSFSLRKNYRSDSRLLSRFENVFEYMGESEMLPYDRTQDRIVGVKTNDIYPDEKLVVKYDYRDSDKKRSDAFYDKLFKVIEEQRKVVSERLETEKLSPAERTIAILVRTNTQIRNVIREANKRHIAVDNELGGELFRIQSTIDLCKLTSALLNPYSIPHLYDLIHSNYINTDFKLSSIYGLSQSEKRELLIECLNSFFIETMERTWEELIGCFQKEPILKMIRLVYEKTAPWKRFSSEDAAQEFYRVNFELLFEMMSNDNRRSYLTLDGVDQWLHVMMIAKDDNKGRTVTAESNGAKVVCLTVHKSKGLEYGTVIMPFTDKSFLKGMENSIDVTYDNGQIGYCFTGESDNAVYPNEYYAVERETKETVMEESRVLYVAMTRAINNFIWFNNLDVEYPSWKSFLERM